MAEFDVAHWFTARYEGGISDHPNDRGGFTAFGISTAFMKDFAASAKNAAFLSGLGLSGVVNRLYMKKISAPIAAKIFRRAFWEPCQLDDFCQQAATVIYDCAVNSGLQTSVRIFQQAINGLIPKNGLKLVADGLYGPKTRAGILAHGREAAIAAIEKRIARFGQIVENNASQRVFLKGWLNRANDLKSYVAKMK